MSQRVITPRPLSRRRFISLTGGAAAGLLLAACAQATPAPATPPAEVAPDEPRHGGRLRWASIGEPEGFFDPALSTGMPMWTACWVYEPLVDIAEDYATLIPRLATSWEAEEGGEVWTFGLRQGVRFHHGREFVAEDVLHSIGRVTDPDFGSPGQAMFSQIVDMDAVDDHTVRFRLQAPNADLPVQMAAFQGKIVPHDLTDEEINSEPRGTGPFTIDTYANADRIVFTRNDDYYVDGLPYLDELESIAIPEATTLANALRAGEVDVYSRVSPAILPTLEGLEDVHVQWTTAIQKTHLFMRLDQPPFDDDRVRRAFKLIADREAMARVVWGDIPVHVEDDNPIIPTNPYHLETDIWQQDLEEARNLLEEAGYGDGLEVTLWAINNLHGVLEYSLAYADWAREAGVTVNVEGVPSGRYYAEQWLEVPFGTVEWTPRLNADEQLRIAYHSDADWNETRYRNPEFDRLLDEARAEVDDERRRELYADLQRMLILEGGQIIPCHYPDAWAVRSHVRDHEPHPYSGLDPRRVWLSE